MNNFTNKNLWALILGGSSGFGLEAAKKLAAEGMNICIVHRNPRNRLNDFANEIKRIEEEFSVVVKTYNINALKTEDRNFVINDLVSSLPRDNKIRVLLHSIAYGNLKLLAPAKPKDAGNSFGEHQQKTDENNLLLELTDFQLTIHSMAITLSEWVKDVFESGLFAPDSRVISLTSEGSKRAWRGYAAVAAAKGAMEAISRAMALEYAPYGIRTNVIQAGITDTPSLRMIPEYKSLLTSSQIRNPFGRLTTPQDVANVVYLLSTDEAAWINGSVISADGGEHIS